MKVETGLLLPFLLATQGLSVAAPPRSPPKVPSPFIAHAYTGEIVMHNLNKDIQGYARPVRSLEACRQFTESIVADYKAQGLLGLGGGFCIDSSGGIRATVKCAFEKVKGSREFEKVCKLDGDVKISPQDLNEGEPQSEIWAHAKQRLSKGQHPAARNFDVPVNGLESCRKYTETVINAGARWAYTVGSGHQGICTGSDGKILGRITCVTGKGDTWSMAYSPAQCSLDTVKP